jgi:acetyl esterase
VAERAAPVSPCPRTVDPELGNYQQRWADAWSVLPAGATLRERRILGEYIAIDMAPPRPAGVTTSACFMPSGGRMVPIRIDRHVDAGVQKCLVYFHGGGFSQGSPTTHSDITLFIAASNRQTVLSVDYALAPEHPYPAAFNECRDALVWVRANAEALGIDPLQIAVGGDSAGANLAAAVCLSLRGAADAPVAQLLAYPCLHFEMALPSYDENADAPLLKTAMLGAMNRAYCPDERDRRSAFAAPLHAGDFTGLPPAFIGVADLDPLRDDGYAYAEKLRAAHVPVEFDDGQGMFHGYLRALNFAEASRRRLARMCAWLDRQYSSSASPI